MNLRLVGVDEVPLSREGPRNLLDQCGWRSWGSAGRAVAVGLYGESGGTLPCLRRNLASRFALFRTEIGR